MAKNMYLVRFYNKDGKILTFERFSYTSHKYVHNAVKRLLSSSLYMACFSDKPELYNIFLDNDFGKNLKLIDSGFCEGA